MSTPARGLRYSYGDYLRLEEDSVVRHEYLDGEIYAKPGGSPEHALLAAAVIGLLGSRIPRGCRVFTSNLRVRIQKTGLTTYPDAAVICGPASRSEEDRLAVVNPVLLVEVTSPSTEDYDRGEKLRHYQTLPSLREILFVSHRESRLTLHRREEQGWTEREARAGETLELQAIAAHLTVDEVYADSFEDA